MILDMTGNASVYASMGERLGNGLGFLVDTDVASMADGLAPKLVPEEGVEPSRGVNLTGF